MLDFQRLLSFGFLLGPIDVNRISTVENILVVQGLKTADGVLVRLETHESEEFLFELVFFSVDWTDFAEGRAKSLKIWRLIKRWKIMFKKNFRKILEKYFSLRYFLLAIIYMGGYLRSLLWSFCCNLVSDIYVKFLK